jgi:hypothetical protein
VDAAAAADTLLYVPAAHSVQETAPSPLQLPAGQGTQVALLVAAPAVLEDPAEHGVGEVDPRGQKLPGGHGPLQSEVGLPPAPYTPAAQTAHVAFVVALVALEKVPAGQRVGVAEEGGQWPPGGHCVGAAEEGAQ